jgi:hypothetical protein
MRKEEGPLLMDLKGPTRSWNLFCKFVREYIK